MDQSETMTLWRGYPVDNTKVALSKWDQPGVFANFQFFKVLEQSNKWGRCGELGVKEVKPSIEPYVGHFRPE